MACGGGSSGGNNWRLIALVLALIFSLIAFCRNTVDAMYRVYRVFVGLDANGANQYMNTSPHGGWTNEDQVLTAGFA